MKDEQRVYIKGSVEKGDEVIKTLIDLGGRNIRDYCGNYNSCYYYINPDGVIDYANTDKSAVYPFLKEFYKEIQPQRWKPKYKEHFYRITWTGEVVEDICYNSRRDSKLCFEFGNCFRTKEEAEAARDKIKETLKK